MPPETKVRMPFRCESCGTVAYETGTYHKAVGRWSIFCAHCGAEKPASMAREEEVREVRILFMPFEDERFPLGLLDEGRLPPADKVRPAHLMMLEYAKTKRQQVIDPIMFEWMEQEILRLEKRCYGQT